MTTWRPRRSCPTPVHTGCRRCCGRRKRIQEERILLRRLVDGVQADRPAFVPGRADHFGRRVAVGDILYFPGVLARYEQAQFLGRERVLAADAHAVGVVDALVVIRAAGDGGIDVESREVENIDRVGAHRDFIRGGSVFAPGVILVVSADGVLAQRDGHTRFDLEFRKADQRTRVVLFGALAVLISGFDSEDQAVPQFGRRSLHGHVVELVDPFAFVGVGDEEGRAAQRVDQRGVVLGIAQLVARIFETTPDESALEGLHRARRRR